MLKKRTNRVRWFTIYVLGLASNLLGLYLILEREEFQCKWFIYLYIVVMFFIAMYDFFFEAPEISKAQEKKTGFVLDTILIRLPGLCLIVISFFVALLHQNWWPVIVLITLLVAYTVIIPKKNK